MESEVIAIMGEVRLVLLIIQYHKFLILDMFSYVFVRFLRGCDLVYCSKLVWFGKEGI